MNTSSTSINSSSEDIKLEAEGRATRRKHINDLAVGAKLGAIDGLELGDKVRKAIKRSAN